MKSVFTVVWHTGDESSTLESYSTKEKALLAIFDELKKNDDDIPSISLPWLTDNNGKPLVYIQKDFYDGSDIIWSSDCADFTDLALDDETRGIFFDFFKTDADKAKFVEDYIAGCEKYGVWGYYRVNESEVK